MVLHLYVSNIILIFKKRYIRDQNLHCKMTTPKIIFSLPPEETNDVEIIHSVIFHIATGKIADNPN